MISSRSLVIALFAVTFCLCFCATSQAFHWHINPYSTANFHSVLNPAFGVPEWDDFDYIDSVFSRPAFDPFRVMKRMQEQQFKMERRNRDFLRALEERAAQFSASRLDQEEGSTTAKQEAVSEGDQPTKTSQGIAEVTSESQSDLLKEEPSTEGSERVPAKSSSTPGQVSSVFGFTRIPKIEISHNDEEFSLAAEVPGMRKEDLKVRINEDDFGHRTLSISGERKQEEKGESSSRSVYGSFSRSFTLPRDVKTDGISATYENGVLNIKVPRDKSKVVTRQIDIA